MIFYESVNVDQADELCFVLPWSENGPEEHHKHGICNIYNYM